MGGLKNPYQLYGASPLSKVEGADIMQRHMNMESTRITVYCGVCGDEIIEAGNDPTGRHVDYQWERANQIHSRCYQMMMKR